MSRGSSVPVQVLQGLHDAGLARAAVFAPFTGDDLEATATVAGDSATERDLLLMEHLPTVRYLARRIMNGCRSMWSWTNLVSAGVVG